MSEKQAELMEKLEKALPNVPEERQDYFAGFVDGVSAMCTPKPKKKSKKDKKVTA